jgi:hypothetical protein
MLRPSCGDLCRLGVGTVNQPVGLEAVPTAVAPYRKRERPLSRTREAARPTTRNSDCDPVSSICWGRRPPNYRLITSAAVMNLLVNVVG